MLQMYLERLIEGSSVEWSTLRSEITGEEEHIIVFAHTCLGSKSSEIQSQGLFKHASVSKCKS